MIPARQLAIEPLFGLAVGARVAGVHVQAVGAAVDLRGAGLDELDQRFFQTGSRDLGFCSCAIISFTAT